MSVRRHLTPSLAAAITLFAMPVAAFAQGTEEQQQACTPDALKLCSDTIPDIGKTTACMKAHFAQLSPRCQTAFGEATGAAKTKTASRKAEAARPKVATRTERRMPERDARESRPEREARTPRLEREARAPRPEREAELPPRPVPDASSEVDPTQPPGFPPFPSRDASPVRPRSQLVRACDAGLIDSFTCNTTLPAILGAVAQ